MESPWADENNYNEGENSWLVVSLIFKILSVMFSCFMLVVDLSIMTD